VIYLLFVKVEVKKKLKKNKKGLRRVQWHIALGEAGKPAFGFSQLRRVPWPFLSAKRIFGIKKKVTKKPKTIF
jgi:hypothetical protein